MRGSLAGLLAVAVTALAAGCGGGERQDADAPTGTFAVDVTAASFPAEQSISSAAVLSLEVANASDQAVPDLAITVETRAPEGDAPAAFGQRTGAGPADAQQPVWVLDEGPMGGDSAYDNTWSLGELGPGERTHRRVEAHAGAPRHVHGRLPARARPRRRPPASRARTRPASSRSRSPTSPFPRP